MTNNLMFCLNMVVNNASVAVCFDWTGKGDDGEPDWETLEVHALLPTPEPSKAKYWVVINDVLSDDDWVCIEAEIYRRFDELTQQAVDKGYLDYDE